MKKQELRHDWTKDELLEIYNSPLLDLVYQAASVHRAWHPAGMKCRFQPYCR